MPHLTPMSWLMAMITVWTLISIMNIQQWSSKPMKFNKTTNKTNKATKKSSWLW